MRGTKHRRGVGIARTLGPLTLVAVTAAGGCGDSASSNTGPPGGDGMLPGAIEYDVSYATLIGGSGFEEVREPVALPGGRLLFGARTLSHNMPTAGSPYQGSHGGGVGDSYLAILSADGRNLEAATYFGGSGMERPPYGIEVAPGGDIIFGSGTTSPNLPTTASSFRQHLHNPVPSPGDGYVCRISPSLSTIRWCTYTGGGWPRGGLSLDAAGNPVVGGRAIGANFPTTAGVVQTEARGGDDAFIMKLRSDGTDAIFSTRLGGSASRLQEVAMGVRVDQTDGTVYAAGNTHSNDFPTTTGAAQQSSIGPMDGWVAHLSSDGTTLLFSTLLGGSGDLEGCEHRILVQPDGSVICSGSTNSSNFPVTIGGTGNLRQAHVSELSPGGGSFRFIRMLGGSGDDHALAPTTDSRGNIYVVGGTDSRDLPVTEGAYQTEFGGGDEDGAIWVLSPDGSEILYASYLGGSGEDFLRGIAIGPNDEIYVVGRTNSPDFPVTDGAFQTTNLGEEDGFVIKLVPRQ